MGDCAVHPMEGLVCSHTISLSEPSSDAHTQKSCPGALARGRLHLTEYVICLELSPIAFHGTHKRTDQMVRVATVLLLHRRAFGGGAPMWQVAGLHLLRDLSGFQAHLCRTEFDTMVKHIPLMIETGFHYFLLL